MARPVLKPGATYGINEYATKWIVILKRGGKSIAKSFAFTTYGGRAAALLQAQAWRDEQAYLNPQAERRTLAQRVRRDNVSGVPGVHCLFGPDGLPKRWTAKTTIATGRTLRASFGVAMHGNEGAKQKAIAARLSHLDQMKGRISFHPADDIDPDAPSPPPTILRAPTAPKSGIVGVQLTRNSSGLPESWIARTTINGRRVQESFAISTYGDARAKAFAIAARARQLEQAARIASHGDSEPAPSTASQHLDSAPASLSPGATSFCVSYAKTCAPNPGVAG